MHVSIGTIYKYGLLSPLQSNLEAGIPGHKIPPVIYVKEEKETCMLFHSKVTILNINNIQRHKISGEK